MKNGIVLSIVGVIIILMVGCRKKLTPVCDSGPAPTYLRDIRPIIETNCLGGGCHDSGSENGDFTTYLDLHKTVMTKAFNKRVLEKQNMPEDKSLTQEEINMFQCWKEYGYLED